MTAARRVTLADLAALDNAIRQADVRVAALRDHLADAITTAERLRQRQAAAVATYNRQAARPLVDQ